MTEVKQLIEAITSYGQLDEEGIMVSISRQACDEAAQALRALSARPAGWRVKPLHWHGPFPANGFKRGRWTAGNFSVVRKGQEYWRVFYNRIDEKSVVFPTAEAAKNAAQADYERRLSEAFEPAPITKEQAAQVLLAAQHNHTIRDYPDNMGPLNQLSMTALKAIAEGKT